MPQGVLADRFEDNIRGVERNERYFGDSLRSLLSAGLYVPRKVYDVTLVGAAKTAGTLSDPDFIETVKDILYIYERDLLWFPIVDYSSGSRFEYGAGLYYSNGPLKGLLKASQHDSDFWDYSAKVSYKKPVGNLFWETSLFGRIHKRDDMQFYGIGGNPEDDTRSGFITLTDQDYGVFTMERRKLQWGTSISHPSNLWEVAYLGFYERKSFENSGKGHNDLEDVFDLSVIPGFSRGPVAQVYNELSFTYDTRRNQKRLTPGFRAETYYGISAGVSGNPSDLWRTGVDVAGFIPVIKEDRILVPRVILDYVDNLSSADIPFSEYTKHQTFRGASERKWIRNDQASVAPSLEYQWPLGPFVSGHAFIDYVAVGKNFHSVEWKHGIWAAGGGFDVHYAEHELGRLQFSGGSEGFYISFTIGKPLARNSRAG